MRDLICTFISELPDALSYLRFLWSRLTKIFLIRRRKFHHGAQVVLHTPYMKQRSRGWINALHRRLSFTYQLLSFCIKTYQTKPVGSRLEERPRSRQRRIGRRASDSALDSDFQVKGKEYCRLLVVQQSTICIVFVDYHIRSRNRHLPSTCHVVSLKWGDSLMRSKSIQALHMHLYHSRDSQWRRLATALRSSTVWLHLLMYM